MIVARCSCQRGTVARVYETFMCPVLVHRLRQQLGFIHLHNDCIACMTICMWIASYQKDGELAA